MRNSLTFAALIAFMAPPVLADHGNPWAGEDDVVFSKYHDANQLKSVGTPGEDEMKGVVAQNGTIRTGRASDSNVRGTGGSRGSEAGRGMLHGKQSGRLTGRN